MKKVLVLEDDPSITHLLKYKLTREGYDVTHFTTGENVIAYLLENEPNLIISDIMMPVVDGLTLLREIKSDKRVSHIPVILLSAISQEEMVNEGLNAGASNYLTKPFSANELLEVVRRTIL